MPDERRDYDRAWDFIKEMSAGMKEAGIPDHEMPPAVADFLIMAVLAMGRSNGLSVQAARAIIERMEGKIEDFTHGNPPFSEAFHETEEQIEARIVENFIRCMAEFVMWSRLARGEISEYGGDEMLRHGYEKLPEIIDPVQGNRGEGATFGAIDQAAILDAVSHWHLSLRESE